MGDSTWFLHPNNKKRKTKSSSLLTASPQIKIWLWRLHHLQFVKERKGTAQSPDFQEFLPSRIAPIPFSLYRLKETSDYYSPPHSVHQETKEKTDTAARFLELFGNYPPALSLHKREKVFRTYCYSGTSYRRYSYNPPPPPSRPQTDAGKGFLFIISILCSVVYTGPRRPQQ